jgi:demethylmenaquinone methyltransferase / 2-methoxy-6-polyprenyl-1,4-benzoquinol methylase
MKIKPYHDSDAGKKSQVSQMFDNIAGKYDFLNRFLSLGIDVIWRKKAIASIGELPLDFVLDIATGTADLAIAIHKKHPEAKITGIDISNKMLDVGRKKIAEKQFQQSIELIYGDSENIPFADQSFNLVTAAFGVRNFENLELGLSEMARVLKTDGKVMILEFSNPSVFPFKQLFNFYFKYILPIIGRLTSKDKRAYQYLYESVQAFPSGNSFLDVMKKSGFREVNQKELSFGICSIYMGLK